MSELAVVPRRSFGEVSFSSVGSVLIIDDEAEIRESLRTLLELEGYEVDVAGSADEGASRLGERAFDLVLLDLALPDRNGLDLLADLRAQEPQQAVIMITAYGDPETRRKALAEGASGLLTKPIDFSALREEIDTRLAQTS